MTLDLSCKLIMMKPEDEAAIAAAAVESVMQEDTVMHEDAAIVDEGTVDEGTVDDGTVDDGDDEPSSKKPRTGASLSPRERNKYKGMRIRQCLCGKPECLPRLKGWINLNDSKRQGFKELPRQSSKTTPVGLEKNRVRDIMFLHIKGHRSPKYDESDKTNRERKLFVAFHHFHPLMLQEDNKGPYQYIYLELAERIGGFAEGDTVQNLPGIVFHAIPNYPKEFADRDFEIVGGIEQQRYARPRKSLASPMKPRTEKKDNYTMRSRVRDVLGQMEHDPLKVANDYLEMHERLKAYEEQESSKAYEDMVQDVKPEAIQQHEVVASMDDEDDDHKFGGTVVDV